jgi:hypothetical protein
LIIEVKSETVIRTFLQQDVSGTGEANAN